MTQTLTPTPEQEAFCQALWAGKPCFLSARAGTGKTSTIKLALELAPKPLDCTVIAFNKQNQEDLQKALGGRIRVATLHSLGFAALRQFMPGLELNTGKLFELTKQHRLKGRNPRQRFSDTMRLVSCAKNWGLVPSRPQGKKPSFKPGLVPDTPESWLALVDHFELWEADLEAAREILQESNELFWTQHQIDFDDMVYLPVALGLQVFSSSLMLVDEAQDLSPLNLRMLQKTPAKIWYVGDPFQCIYTWRGSDEDVLTSLNLPELPLTTCWRCDQAIIRQAQRYVPDIKARAEAEPGQVQLYSEMPDWQAEPPAVVLGRTNAALIKLALEMRASQKQVCILGRDLAKTLAGILEEFKGNTRARLLEETQTWFNKMSDRYPHKQLEFRDLARCLQAFIQEYHGVPAILRELGRLFSDDPLPGAWILSTIHKAKGREWPRVWLLNWSGSGLSQPWQVKEDRNLRYVATTRAKHFLGIIDETAWNPEAKLPDWRQL